MLDIYRRAVSYFGATKQKLKAIEEMAELIVELVKDLLGDGNPAKVIEELADVENMTVQLQIIYDEDGMVDYWKQAKMNRLAHRMDETPNAEENHRRAAGASDRRGLRDYARHRPRREKVCYQGDERKQ